MKRTLMMVVVAAVAAVASVTAAQAAVVTNSTDSFAYAGWVPCANGGAGELMTGTIDAHVLVTSTVNDNVDVTQFAFAPRGSLVGRVTGDTYRLTGVARGTYVDVQKSDRYTLTYVNRYLLIGPGPGNNLVVQETAHVTRDGDDVIVARDDFSVTCG